MTQNTNRLQGAETGLNRLLFYLGLAQGTKAPLQQTLLKVSAESQSHLPAILGLAGVDACVV